MKITRDLDQQERNALKENYRHQQNFTTHWKCVLDKPHCFVASIFPEDYLRILIHSCLPNITRDFPYQSLSEAITYIKMHQNFLKEKSNGCLNGEQVQYYLDRLSACQRNLWDCFMDLGDCFMLDKSEPSARMRNEITDGMHRLVAYGLATDMDENYFPIPVYLGTNKTSSIVEKDYRQNG